MRSFLRHEFETRSLLANRRGVAYYVADPFSPIHPPPHMRYDVAGEFTPNDQTTCLMVRDSWFRPGM
jgi:hypothetical protein